MSEWPRFQKYARRMRTLTERGAIYDPTAQLLSILQLCTTNEPLLPNLKRFRLWSTAGEFIPFVPLFLSPRTTVVDIEFKKSGLPKAKVASMLAAFPMLCPNLQKITLQSLPTDPIITVAVSNMLLASNRDNLRCFQVDSPLTEEAREVVYKLPDLRELSVVIERDTSLPSVVLPNLTELAISCDDKGDWVQLFHRATFGRLEGVTFYPRSKQIGDLLEAFKKIALATSTLNMLSELSIYTTRSWNPSYSSLLPFTKLTYLLIQFTCDDECSSGVDDNVIMDLAQAMPKLKTLILGDGPCSEITIGVTAEGLAALAHRCPNLSTLCVHFLVDTLSADPSTIGGATSNVGSAPLRKDCALTDLEVGHIPLPEESVSAVTLTLARIFPHINCIDYADKNWERVLDAIRLSRQLPIAQVRNAFSLHLKAALMTPLQEPLARAIVSR